MDLDDWQIIADYDQNEKAVATFSFLIHKSSQKSCVRWVYTGFNGHVLADSKYDYG